MLPVYSAKKTVVSLWSTATRDVALHVDEHAATPPSSDDSIAHTYDSVARPSEKYSVQYSIGATVGAGAGDVAAPARASALAADASGLALSSAAHSAGESHDVDVPAGRARPRAARLLRALLAEHVLLEAVALRTAPTRRATRPWRASARTAAVNAIDRAAVTGARLLGARRRNVQRMLDSAVAAGHRGSRKWVTSRRRWARRS